MLRKTLICSALSLALLPDAQADNAAFARCAQDFAHDREARLNCYDQAAALPPATPATPTMSDTAANRPAAETPATAQPEDSVARCLSKRRELPDKRSYLTRTWNLDDRVHCDPSSLERLQPYRQSYLIVRKSSNTNNQPTSPAPGRSVLTPYDLDAMEAKFQLSFKTDIGTYDHLDRYGFKTLRFWGGYTQQSQWQVFNTRNSSPFRETNYEPELIATLSTEGTGSWKLLNLGVVHQSNGRSNPESRSWNRIYAQGGWEWDNHVALLARGWWRIPESVVRDDNPDIAHYLGHGDLLLRWEPDDRRQALAFLLRNNLNLNHNTHFLQLDWSTPLPLGHAGRLHFQFGDGYGESLIDYNQRQTTLGLGLSFREW